METEDSAESRYGFRIRGALGEVLGLVVIALPQPEARMDLGAVHALIKLALDCLQSELSARAAIGKLHENLADSSRDLFDNPRSQSMVVAITKLAHTFGMETVAGHVETDAIRARVAQLGVDYGQGFFIGKPLALDDAIQDLPLYSCFATSTGLFDGSMVQAAAQGS
jgi:predicted signal transduction protein with EAL and GGDEF domain